MSTARDAQAEGWPGQAAGSNQKSECNLVQQLSSLSGWDSEATALPVCGQGSGFSESLGASEATVSFGRLLPPQRSVALKRRGHTLLFSASYHLNKRIYLSSEAASHDDTAEQQAAKLTSEDNEDDEECQSSRQNAL
ncbi:hypothetical protein WJX81_008666 [Elliptochloris bilobata]|uniref:Uncharacterized protein n=1 Tax=Elliptochloris bilobata TaxID=381761 RepID=A0AAW1QC89_9CHLO